MKKSISSTLHLLGLLAMPLLLTACATTGGIKPEQCTSADWQGIGYQDGLLGHNANFIYNHAKRCAKAGVTPNQVLWEQGRQNGLKRYCTPLRAYQLGREGINYNNVCPPEQMLDLLKAHDEGYMNYQREATLNQLWYDDFPIWGERWDSPYDGNYHHFGGWMRLPTPHTVPDYIDMAEQSQNSPSQINPAQNKSSDTTVTPNTTPNP